MHLFGYSKEALLDSLSDMSSDLGYRLFVCLVTLVTSFLQVENLALTFVCTIDSGFGKHTEIELLPGGRSITVNAENRQLFVNLKVQKQVMEPVAEQIRALREGMESLLPEGVSWAHVFAPLTDEVRKRSGVGKSSHSRMWLQGLACFALV